jgi:vancomycin resistance protein YoaR
VAGARRQRAVRRGREAGASSDRRRGLAPDGPWDLRLDLRGSGSSIPPRLPRLKQTRADLTTAEATKLGIRQQISTFTTDMGTSSSNRIHNVQLMAEYIDGTIVAPGQEFSFNDRVGPRTVERGFREGQMIIGSLLLPAIGGGVCQTATTLFNNAFDLGLPIVRGGTTTA